MNVDDYLARIKYTGSKEPNLENLKAIFHAHKTNLSYSNLRMHGADDDNNIQLDLNMMYDHVITNNGAGLGFELNELCLWLLKKIGYDAYAASAAYNYRKGLSRPDLHMVILVKLGGELYYADSGMSIYGVFKVKHMEVTVTPFNVYRFREVPSDEGTTLFFERHSKTVLDDGGNILKEGHCITGYKDCSNNPECQKENSEHWRVLMVIDPKATELKDYENVWNYLKSDPNSEMRRQLIVNRFELDPKPSFYFVLGESYQKKLAVDPIIDQIVCSEELRSNADVEKVVNEVFNFNLTHSVKYYKLEE